MSSTIGGNRPEFFSFSQLQNITKIMETADFKGAKVEKEAEKPEQTDTVEGIDWVVANNDRLGITGMNLSLGGAPDDYPCYFDPIDMAVEKAWEKGIVVVSAAGNSGPGEHIAGPGTSFATPIISGIAANLREEAPDANPDDIKNTIMDTADSMGEIYGKYDQGRGFVNAKRAGEKLKA